MDQAGRRSWDRLITLDFPLEVIGPETLRDLLRRIAARAAALAGGE